LKPESRNEPLIEEKKSVSFEQQLFRHFTYSDDVEEGALTVSIST
jgi:hypothetical protein